MHLFFIILCSYFFGFFVVISCNLSLAALCFIILFILLVEVFVFVQTAGD